MFQTLSEKSYADLAGKEEKCAGWLQDKALQRLHRGIIPLEQQNSMVAYTIFAVILSLYQADVLCLFLKIVKQSPFSPLQKKKFT